MTLPAFPVVEPPVCALLAGFGQCGIRTPDDGIRPHLPFNLLHVIGGTSDQITDYAALDVDTFDLSVTAALDRAARIQAFLCYGGPHIVNGVVFDGFTTSTRPHDIPYGLPGVFRTSATYRVTTRRQ
jgi:hypothetical protein